MSGILRVLALCLSGLALLCTVLAICQERLELAAAEDDDFDDFDDDDLEDWDD